MPTDLTYEGVDFKAEMGVGRGKCRSKSAAVQHSRAVPSEGVQQHLAELTCSPYGCIPSLQTGLIHNYTFSTTSNTTQPCTELFCPQYSLGISPDPLRQAATARRRSLLQNKSAAQGTARPEVYSAVGLDSGALAGVDAVCGWDVKKSCRGPWRAMSRSLAGCHQTSQPSPPPPRPLNCRHPSLRFRAQEAQPGPAAGREWVDGLPIQQVSLLLHPVSVSNPAGALYLGQPLVCTCLLQQPVMPWRGHFSASTPCCDSHCTAATITMHSLDNRSSSAQKASFKGEGGGWCRRPAGEVGLMCVDRQ